MSEVRLIDANALIHELNNSHFPGAPYVDAGISIAIGKVCNALTIDPVKHGKWKVVLAKWCTSVVAFKCSACGCLSDKITPFCPNCGARMLEGGEDE